MAVEIVLPALEPQPQLQNLRGSKTEERDPSFTASLADIEHERSVITLKISIYSLISPLGTRLHALNRQRSVHFTYFSFAYNNL